MTQRLLRLVALAAAAPLILTSQGAEAQAPRPTSSPQSQVTVEGHRETLQRRVQKFIAQITAGPPDTSLERWRRPVCPLVAGLPAGQGEAMLTRLSQIATKAGVPLAPKRCAANLIVTVTPDPKEFLEAWRQRSGAQIFEDATPTSIQLFIDTARPVRAWYNAQLDDQHGVRLPKLLVASVEDPAGNEVFVNRHAEDTRIELNALEELTSVILVVDAQSIQHLTIGQVADYVGMVGLGKLNTDAPTADVPTILNLFTSTQSTPTGLTEWDEAFLYALYHTPQSARMQRSMMTQSVVEDIDE
jgi:hypothetical protein